MTTSDKENENESTSPEDRLEEIKKEEKEDASSYYAQGQEEKPDTEKQFSEPVPPVDKEQEEMSLVKALAFLGFGLAMLAIIFIAFFVRDLDQRVGGVDSAVTKLEEAIAPLRAELKGEMDQGFNKLNTDLAGLKTKVGEYERSMAVVELKRALVTLQGVSSGSTRPEVKARTDAVAASIHSLLQELGETSTGPAGTLTVEEAAEPAAAEAPEAPAAEPEAAATEELPTVEELLGVEGEAAPAAPAEEAHAEEAPAAAAPAAEEAAEEAPAAEEADSGADDEGDDEEEEDE
jgi:hypothetical protein